MAVSCREILGVKKKREGADRKKGRRRKKGREEKRGRENRERRGKKMVAQGRGAPPALAL